MGRTGAPSLLPLLRSHTQAEVLQRLFLQPDREWTVAELAADIGVSAVSLRRELDRLRRASVLAERLIGRTRVVRADPASPLFEPLRELIERSVGVEAELRRVLGEMPGVEAATIFGSWARGDVDAESDVDVLVVGTVDYGDLVERLSAVRDRVGRDISPVVVAMGELHARHAEGSGFAHELLTSPRIPLVGGLPTPKERRRDRGTLEGVPATRHRDQRVST